MDIRFGGSRRWYTFGMDRIVKLENEIRSLSDEELSAFRQWFREFDSEVWDREVEADVRAGKLDSFADKAIADHRSGKSASL